MSDTSLVFRSLSFSRNRPYALVCILKCETSMLTPFSVQCPLKFTPLSTAAVFGSVCGIFLYFLSEEPWTHGSFPICETFHFKSCVSYSAPLFWSCWFLTLLMLFSLTYFALRDVDCLDCLFCFIWVILGQQIVFLLANSSRFLQLWTVVTATLLLPLHRHLFQDHLLFRRERIIRLWIMR